MLIIRISLITQFGNFSNTNQLQQSMEIGNSKAKFFHSRGGKLPYIVINNPIRKLKFIINTGAEFTIINPNISQSKWK